MKFELINGDVYNGTIEQETDHKIKIKVSDNEMVVLNKRFLK